MRLRSLSGFYLAAAFALGISAIAGPAATSWYRIFREHDITPAGLARCYVDAGLPLAVVVAYWLLGRYDARVGSRLLRLSAPPALDPQMAQRLAAGFPGANGAEFRVVGNPLAVHDGGGALRTGPRAYQWPEAKDRRRVVFVPALCWQRLAKYPAALEAVLAHELAHFQHDDFRLLLGSSRLLRLASAGLLASLGLAICATFLVHQADGWLKALNVGAVGHAYQVSQIFSSLILVLLAARMVAWREALADAAATAHSGAENLRLADALVEGLAPPVGVATDDGPPREPFVAADDPIRLRPFDVALAGWTVSTATNTVWGVIHFLGERDVVWLRPVVPVVDLGAGCTLIVAIYLALRIAARTRGISSSLSDAVEISLSLFAGICASVLLEWLPLVAGSVLMPREYDYFIRYDLSRVPAQLFVAEPARFAFFVVCALGLHMAFRGVRSSWPGVLFTISGGCLVALEVTRFPDLGEGLIAPLILVSLILAGWATNRGEWGSVVEQRQPAFVALVLYAAIHAAGFGFTNHWAACLLSAGTRVAEIDPAKAAGFFRKSALRAPLWPEPWIQLASILVQTASDEEARRTACDRAVGAWYGAVLHKRFDVLAVAASCELMAGEQCRQAVAHDWFSQAEKIWRINTRVSSLNAADMFYNYACLLAREQSGDLAALLRLNQAIALNRTLARSAETDPDLSRFWVPDTVTVTPELKARLERGLWEFEQDARIGIVAERDAIGLLRLLAWRSIEKRPAAGAPR